MTLKEQIDNDFKEAYKARNMAKKTFLGVVKGAIQTQEGNMVPSTDENVLKIVKKFEKSINEMITSKIKLGHSVEDEKLELEYIQPYLPQLMGEDEIRAIVKDLVSRPDINKNQGVLMGTFNREQKGKAFDNKTVSKIITESLV